MVRRWVIALPLVVAVACSHPRLGPGEAFNSQVITEDEIVASRASNAYDVIHKLRANFLTNRGQTGVNRSQANSYPTVYVDDQEFGPISTSVPGIQVCELLPQSARLADRLAILRAVTSRDNALS